MEELRFRQVHLDFHTSEGIKDIGKNFEKVQFQNALKKGYVDSVTLFSKCHHGWAYHPSKVNQMHPNLEYDLLGEQLNACGEIGVKAPVYLSAGCDEKEAVLHPEWIARKKDDSAYSDVDYVEKAGYHLLCFNTGYLELLLAEIEEVMERYNPVGIFLDISSVHPCYCSKCRKDMLENGKDPREFTAVMEQAEKVYQNYAQKVMAVVRKHSETCTVFHNGGHIAKGRRDIAGYNTHLELESLPTGGWGYQHFPMSASYTCNLGLEYLGMTGKFHSSWGEFGGFKHPNALRYETSLSLAMGAKCSIGDQLHPSGKMEVATYELIGKAYEDVEKKEPWCTQSTHCSDIAVLSQEAFNSSTSNRDDQFWGDIGANRMLLEGNYLYSFIDEEEALNGFKLVILPDSIRLTDSYQKKLKQYMDDGGKLLVSGASGLWNEKDVFAVEVGAEYIGYNEFRPDYVLQGTGAELNARVMYEQGHRIRKTKGRIFLERQNPYFNRDITHFCSHQHTPNEESYIETAGIVTENTVYIGWDIFTDYGKRGSLHDKQIVNAAIDELLAGKATLETDLPDRGVVTLTKQETEQRYITHLVFAHTTIRGEAENGHPMEVIEDIVPLHDIHIGIKIPEKIKKVYLAPQMTELSYTEENGRIMCTVPNIDCHQMIVLQY